jgi:RimJ/RimL family protein N-acetyltransferase
MAEVAFTVEEGFHGQGNAGRLQQRLIKIAKEREVSFLEAEVLSSNKAMMAVFKKSGLPMKVQMEGRTCIVAMALNEVTEFKIRL